MQYFKPQALALAIASATLSYQVSADTFNVTAAQDNGRADTAGTLSWAIAQANDPNGQTGRANGSVGRDTINLKTDVTLTGIPFSLIDSDIIINGNNHFISGADKYRPLFIKSGKVELRNLTIKEGLAEGQSKYSAGSGAGLGGGIFIYGGQVTIKNSSIEDNNAVGGGQGSKQGAGGGGMQAWKQTHSNTGEVRAIAAKAAVPTVNHDHGGSLFGNAVHGNQQHSANDNYQDEEARNGKNGGFGEGGRLGNTNGASGNGGFGGGGGYGSYVNAGHGGFGGGGGYSYSYSPTDLSDAGDGGFGAGGGVSYGPGKEGTGGFGGGDAQSNEGGHGAGMGGGLFIRSGSLDLKDVQFSNNTAKSGEPVVNNNPIKVAAAAPAPAPVPVLNKAKAYGGAIFVLHTKTNDNSNNQGMPTELPTVTGCEVEFGVDGTANIAADDFNSKNTANIFAGNAITFDDDCTTTSKPTPNPGSNNQQEPPKNPSEPTPNEPAPAEPNETPNDDSGSSSSGGGLAWLLLSLPLFLRRKLFG